MYSRLRAQVRQMLAERNQDYVQLVRSKMQNSSRGLSRAAAEAEVIADACEMMLQDTGAIKRLAQRDAGLVGKILAFLKEFARRLKRALEGVTATSTEAQALMDVRDGVERYVEELQDAWDNAAVEAAQNGRKRGTVEVRKGATAGDIRYSQRGNDDSDVSSIKEQLRSVQSMLNEMQVVADVTAPDMSKWNKSKRREWAIESLASTGYQVSIQGIGNIEFNKAQINMSLNYLNSSEEVAAFKCLPRVLKRGIQATGHENHKGRYYSTITFAAPVSINGTRGNMAVVVKRIGRNLYKTHRILMPDGSAFHYDETKKAEPTPAGGIPQSFEAQATHISSADSIVQEFDNSVKSYSDRTSTPSVRQYSYAGRDSRTRDTSRFEQAQELEENGASNEDIRQQTGWFKGMDGQWRYEIDDSKATIVGIDMDRVMMLSDMMEHPDLFEAYPELKSTPIIFTDLPDGTVGRAVGRGIMLSRNHFSEDGLTVAENKELLRTLLHELQHQIQRIEGFTRGSNWRYWQEKLDEGLRIGSGDAGIRKAERTRSEYFDKLSNEMKSLIRQRNQLILDQKEQELLFMEAESAEDAEAAWNRASQLQEQIAEIGDKALQLDPSNDALWTYDMMTEAIRRAKANNHQMTSRELYRMTAGEIEARDVESRMGLNESQRRQLPPANDVNAVFVEHPSRRQFSLREVDHSDETLRENMRQVQNMSPVAILHGDEFRMGKTLKSDVGAYYDSLGGYAKSPIFGDIILSKRGVKDSFGHGMGQVKAIMYHAVPDVIERGKLIDYRDNWKGREYDTAIIAAPVEISHGDHRGDYWLGVIVNLYPNRYQRFYVHEAIVVQKKSAPVVLTGTPEGETLGNGEHSLNSVLEKLNIVNTRAEDSNSDRPSRQHSDRTPAPSLRQTLAAMEVTPYMNETERVLLEGYKKNVAELAEKQEQIRRMEAVLSIDSVSAEEKAKARERLKIFRSQARRIEKRLRLAEQNEGFASLMRTSRGLVREIMSGGSAEDFAKQTEERLKGLRTEMSALQEELKGMAADQRLQLARSLFDPKKLEAAKIPPCPQLDDVL